MKQPNTDYLHTSDSYQVFVEIEDKVYYSHYLRKYTSRKGFKKGINDDVLNLIYKVLECSPIDVDFLGI